MEAREIHVWHHCHCCGARPILGKRYHCTTCPAGPDNDLCADCFARYQADGSLHPTAGLYQNLNKGLEHKFIIESGQSEKIYGAWLNVPQGDGQEFSSAPGFLVRPEFVTSASSYFGGHAFIARYKGKVLLLTALHVLDELIKAHNIDSTVGNTAYTGRELPAVLAGVNLYDVLQERWMFHDLGKAGPMLALKNARTDEEEPYSYRDIAAFEIQDSASLSPLPLADHTPDVGQPVWLVARTDKHGHCHKAVVVEKTEKSLVFRFSDSEIKFRATSGAPILNAKKEIVGINVGAGAYQQGLFGHANHVENIRWHLDSL